MSNARFGFIVAALTYFLFLGLEFIRPGFVSYVLSPHLVLVPMVVFGFFVARERAVRPRTSAVWVMVPVGVLFGCMFWFAGDIFGDFRLLLALGVAVLPALAYFSTRDTT